MTGHQWHIRAYRADDQPAVDGLPGADPDPMAMRVHHLHGPDRDGAKWRRTLVAERAGVVVGAVTLARNWMHTGAYTQVLEVHPAHRRRGVGRALLAAARAPAVEDRVLLANVRVADEAGLGMLAALGARLVQSAPCLRPDPGSAVVRGWAARQELPAGVTVAGLAAFPAEVPRDRLVSFLL